jgi:nucleoside-diphosphate-sugar epimerase
MATVLVTGGSGFIGVHCIVDLLNAGHHWDEAHRSAQDIETSEALRVHADLHREECDGAYARYWYPNVGVSREGLDGEWEMLARHLLG